MIKVLRTLLTALLLVVGGASTAVATHGQPERELPIWGAVVGPDEEPDMAATGCSAGGADLLWRFTSSGYGQVSHLGRVEYDFTHCTRVDNSIREGVLTLTAANGDLLVLSYTGVIAPWGPESTSALWTMHWEVDYGTGRFASAAGAGVADAETFIPPLESKTELSISGMISYDASDRASK
jgi:hypothetical protein